MATIDETTRWLEEMRAHEQNASSLRLWTILTADLERLLSIAEAVVAFRDNLDAYMPRSMTGADLEWLANVLDACLEGRKP